MKNVIKMILGLLVGCVIGLLIGMLGGMLFTDIAPAEFVKKLLSSDFMEIAMSVVVALASFALSLFVIVTAHEAGHLVCGLLTGYKFVSFRIFSLTFINTNGRIRVKRFKIAGTGGQCLLTPPDVPLEKLPTAWYNAGGLLVNLLMLIIAVPLLYLDLNAFATESLVIFILIDLILLAMNGIPMKIGGVGNDAYNLLHLNGNLLCKQALAFQLRSNALIQEGVRPKDMPAEWFVWKTDIDFHNPLEVSIPLMHASRLVDKMDWPQAYEEFDDLYQHKSDIIELYVNEIACELAFCAMVTGRLERAGELLDFKLRKYIGAYRKVMSSKQRILCGVALYLDNDHGKALAIYETMKSEKDRYLLQGEVASDLAIMSYMLREPE